MKSVKTEPEKSDLLRDQLISSLQSRISQLQAQKSATNSEPARFSGPVFSTSFQSELQWLANDFKTERQWKREQTKKIGRELFKYLATRETQESKLKKVAASVAREVERYWRSVGEVVKHRNRKRAALKVKEEKSRKLEYLVNKTEKFMGKVVNAMLGHRPPSSRVSVAEISIDSAEDHQEVVESVSHKSPSVSDNLDSDSESSLDVEEAEDLDLEDRERAEAANLLADADRPLDEIMAEMRRKIDSDSESEEDQRSQSSDDEDPPSAELAELAAVQPEGTTLTSSSVTIPIPSLLRGTMRDYQHIGLQWLAALGDRIPGKILADEPGLGKTLQSIALLAHLACAERIWGPHLVVVPTSVLLNWEIEFKKFCPGMKVLVYFGSAKERATLRIGWNKSAMADSSHVQY
ncbi:hypothetical protein C9890_0193 [Perkinsus sp. BL_2016]|nr:hypothetical protein C9890_0193 [Perkinsus sp. BL_2016]